MLQLRPNCEWCDRDLAPDSVDAYICSYECTFCRDCVQTVLRNVCPNCGGGFEKRPVRPARAHRPGVSLQDQPASTAVVQSRFNAEQIADFVAGLEAIEPQRR